VGIVHQVGHDPVDGPPASPRWWGAGVPLSRCSLNTPYGTVTNGKTAPLRRKDLQSATPNMGYPHPASSSRSVVGAGSLRQKPMIPSSRCWICCGSSSTGGGRVESVGLFWRRQIGEDS